MPRMRRLGICVLAVVLLPPATAPAAPPANDNYLSSTSINTRDGSLPREFTERTDTTEAGTQADLFNPSRNGLPFGGAPPEPVACPGAAAYAKTIWYDFTPPIAGGVEIEVAGFDAVVAVYRWSAVDSRLGARVACANESSGTAETVLLQPEIRARQPYTIQVGGVNGTAGPLDFRFSFYPDRDGDTILDDQPDQCPDVAGIGRSAAARRSCAARLA